MASICPGAEVIVADNASTDDSVAFVRERYPQVRMIEMDKNRGFAGGYNEALRQVNSDYYVLLNSDVEVSAGLAGADDRTDGERPRDRGLPTQDPDVRGQRFF